MFLNHNTQNNTQNSFSSTRDSDYRLRWDKANLTNHYGATLHEISKINYDFHFDQCLNNCDCGKLSLQDEWGDQINHALKSASHSTVPMKRENFYKFWWNEELSLLKNISIEAHRVWDSAGRPRSDEIWVNKNAAKQRYKLAIKQFQISDNNNVTNELNDLLLRKDINSFWKTWNSKFANKNGIPNYIDGEADTIKICVKFADYFANACFPNSTERTEQLRQEFQNKYTDYILNTCINNDKYYTLTVEIVDSCVKQLKKKERLQVPMV